MIGQRWLDSYKSLCGKASTCDIVSTGMCICYKLWKLVLIIVKCDTSLKKHVNIFIIHKTTSLTAADTILMTAAMPMWPYFILLRPMKELWKNPPKTMETSTIKWRGQKAVFGWTSGLFITVADENTKCIINFLFLCKWLKHTGKKSYSAVS